MKKEISPEMYNYNKFPGPSFARIGNKVVSENIELNVVDDFKDAFDQTAFGQRFSPIMLKFDYIIGDWGNEQLRLKGFYRDEKPVKSDLKIGRLDDYLTEYCNFGCAYFVLENPNPQELEEEPEEKTSRKRHRSRNRNRQKQRTEELVSKDKKVIRNEPKRSKSTSGTSKEQGRHFTVKNNKPSIGKQQKQERAQKHDKKQHHREMNEAKRGFVIRQK